jgi:hypothetical protein
MNYSGHIDYNLESKLTFKCISCYDFILIYFVMKQYMMHDEKKKWIEKHYNKIF